MRRGFKAEARATANQVRAELGLKQIDCLDPHDLARHLCIPVVPLSQLADCEEAAAYFANVEPRTFSAVTVFAGKHRTIVHNDAHLLGRQHSNISHELAHGLLGHTPTPALDDRGCRFWNQDLEDEASYMGAALLVTVQAALHVVRRDMTLRSASTLYGVSDALMTWNDQRQRRTCARRARTGTTPETLNFSARSRSADAERVPQCGSNSGKRTSDATPGSHVLDRRAQGGVAFCCQLQ